MRSSPAPIFSVFTPEHEEYRQRLRAAMSVWTEDEVASWAARGLPSNAIRTLAEADAFRSRWSAGDERGLPYLVVLSEEAGLVSSGLSLAAMAHSEILIGALELLGQSQAHADLLERSLAGETIGCFAATEPAGGSDLTQLGTTIRRLPHGWRLRGTKKYVSNLALATHAVVLAKLAGSVGGRNLCMVLVPLDSPGVEKVGSYRTAWASACDVGHVNFDVELDEDAVLGGAGGGLIYANHLLQFERISISAQLLAGAQVALKLAAAYSRRRIVSEKRLIDQQAVRHTLANAQSELWAVQTLLHGLVAATADGRPMAHETAATKLRCADVANRIIDNCLQIFGGRGYSESFPLQGLWRDARLARIGGGPDEIMREVVAATLDRPDREFERWLDRLEVADAPTSSMMEHRSDPNDSRIGEWIESEARGVDVGGQMS